MALADIIKFKDVLRQLAGDEDNGVLPFEEFTREFSSEFSKRPRKTERRDSERTELPPIPAEVQPLDDDFEACGPKFAVIVRNISARGIGLMFGKPVQCKYLELLVGTPSGKQLKTVIEVKHCIENGIMIGCSSMTQPRLQ